MHKIRLRGLRSRGLYTIYFMNHWAFMLDRKRTGCEDDLSLFGLHNSVDITGVWGCNKSFLNMIQSTYIHIPTFISQPRWFIVALSLRHSHIWRLHESCASQWSGDTPFATKIASSENQNGLRISIAMLVNGDVRSYMSSTLLSFKHSFFIATRAF